MFSLFKRKKRVSIHTSDPLPSRNNPFKKRQTRRAGVGWALKYLLLPAILLAWVALIIYLPYFRITKINYLGLKIIKKEEIEQEIKEKLFESRLPIPKNNYFLINEEGMAEHLKTKFGFNSVVVKKNFPHHLLIDVEEKISSIIYDNGEQYFLLDQTGAVLKVLGRVEEREFTTELVVATSTSAVSTTVSTTSTRRVHTPNDRRVKTEFGEYPIAYDLRHPTTTEQKTNVLPEPLIQNIISIYNLIEKGKIARIKHVSFAEPAAGLTVFTNQPWQIRLHPYNDLQEQINNVKIILKDNKPSEYMDVRFRDRVFWK